jgi:hypothetical protein
LNFLKINHRVIKNRFGINCLIQQGGNTMAEEEEYNKGGYESMVWIRDKDGKEYACTAAALKGNLKSKEELSDEEKENCMDVSQLIGTERW